MSLTALTRRPVAVVLSEVGHSDSLVARKLVGVGALRAPTHLAEVLWRTSTTSEGLVLLVASERGSRSTAPTSLPTEAQLPSRSLYN